MSGFSFGSSSSSASSLFGPNATRRHHSRGHRCRLSQGGWGGLGALRGAGGGWGGRGWGAAGAGAGAGWGTGGGGLREKRKKGEEKERGGVAGGQGWAAAGERRRERKGKRERRGERKGKREKGVRRRQADWPGLGPEVGRRHWGVSRRHPSPAAGRSPATKKTLG
ncbi:hypothetical protein TIFTF001_032307 [Ficus carica]|uniref:Uncharacterized protein n=1 Tax=Ficus carica TaxID=3494 RepID=A0AA88J5L8_FICCA|nr:hypothetical protein TIFTF001_032307 [Ficus carica]